MVMEKSKIIDMLHNETVNIAFTKVNGEERIMHCTLQEDLLPQQVDIEEAVQRKKPNPDVLAVWDVEAKGWRSFRWDSLKTVNEEQYING